ncbi:Unknown protein, partial [Striga hermonthica]
LGYEPSLQLCSRVTIDDRWSRTLHRRFGAQSTSQSLRKLSAGHDQHQPRFLSSYFAPRAATRVAEVNAS